MTLDTRTETYEHIMTGGVDWAVTPRGSTEPLIESTAELVFYRKLGSIMIPESYDALYGRYPGDSSRAITVRLGLRPIIRGTLEVTGPRGLSEYRRYVGDDEDYTPVGSFTKQVGDVTWEWERSGSWLNADHNPDDILSLSETLRQHPDIAPFDPSDESAQMLVEMAKRSRL